MTSPPKSALDRLSGVHPGRHVVTIGNFDGVHRGHQYLLSAVTEQARSFGVNSLVITFEPHPVSVFRPDIPFPRLASPELKLELLRKQGINEVAVVPFSLEFASLTPEEFLGLISESVSPAMIIVGEGFRFGKDRAGDGDTIRQFGADHGFDTLVLDRLRDNETVISSSFIRQSLREGDVQQAAEALGRRFRLVGYVEHGLSRGRDLGYPTANLTIQDNQCVPADGIYAAFARIAGHDGGARQAMVYIGTSATFDPRERTVEVNILDFDADIYTRQVELEFVDFLRGDVRFDSAGELVAQIHEDERTSRKILSGSASEMNNGD